MIRRMKQLLMVVGLLALVLAGGALFLTFQEKAKSETTIDLSQEEKRQFETLQATKIVTEEEVRGALSDTAFKVTGFEEAGRTIKKVIHSEHYQKLVEKEDSMLMKKGKALLNEWNKRDLYFDFTVDYGLGFDLEPVVSHITVDEATGKVTIPEPDLMLTHFYIDPTFTIEEENGVIIKLLNREFTPEEKAFLIGEMEAGIKEDILTDEAIHTVAANATKHQITSLLEQINPAIAVEFE